MCCRLWEDGWKQRYYKTKFDVDVTDEDFRRRVVQSYVEGLCWVLRYYYQVTLNSLSGFIYIKRCHDLNFPDRVLICNMSILLPNVA